MKNLAFIIGLFLGIYIPATAQSPLCLSYPTTFCCEYVSSVSINGIVRDGAPDATGFSSGPGYFDYTGEVMTSMLSGNTYPVSVTVKTNSTSQEYVKMWFDFNNNLDLTDEGELVLDQVSTFNGTHVYNGNVTIPENVLNGNINIRVVMTYANIPALCGAYSYGTTLDFKASISGGITLHNLTVETTGTGGYSGSVSSSPAGINTIIGNNSASFVDGSIVTLTAVPSEEGFFTGWSGDATGAINPLPVNMNASKNITANFGLPSPPSPTSVTASATVICNGSSSELTASGVVGTVNWYSNSCDGTFVGTGNPITVSPEITTSYFAKNSNNGNSSMDCASITVSVNPIPIINSTENQVVCNGLLTEAINFEGTGATSYNWTNSMPLIGLAESGSGDIGSFIASNYTALPVIAMIDVTPVNSNSGTVCFGTPGSFSFTVNPTPFMAGSITGPSRVCKGSENINYSILPITNASSYIWSVPNGVTINTGDGTNNINVSIADDATNGTISVYGSNNCGNGGTSPEFELMVMEIPLDASPVSGSSSVCQGTLSVVYSVDEIANVTGYAWSVPANATIVNGDNSNSITVDFALNAVSGAISVYGTNDCGNGQASPPLDITVNEIPVTPVITDINPILFSSASTGNQWYDGGREIDGAKDQTYTPDQNGSYYVVVTLNDCSSEVSNVIEKLNVSVTDREASLINVYPNPGNGEFWVEYTNSGNEKLQHIQVIDASGRTVYNSEHLTKSGNSKQWIDLKSCTNGIYRIILKTNEGQITRQIVIAR